MDSNQGNFEISFEQLLPVNNSLIAYPWLQHGKTSAIGSEDIINEKFTARKIADEQQKGSPDFNLIQYWTREISGLEKSLARAEKLLKRGH